MTGGRRSANKRRFRLECGDRKGRLVCACVDVFPDWVPPAAAEGRTTGRPLEETRGIVLREDGIHHEGSAAGTARAMADAPERMEALECDSRGSCLCLEWPPLE